MVAMGADYEELLRVALLKNGPIALAFNANGMDFAPRCGGLRAGLVRSSSIDHRVLRRPGRARSRGPCRRLRHANRLGILSRSVAGRGRGALLGHQELVRSRSARAPPLPPAPQTNGLPTVGILTINVFGACAFSTGGEAIGAKMDTTASCAVTITAASRTLRSTPWSTKSLRSESRNERPTLNTPL